MQAGIFLAIAASFLNMLTNRERKPLDVKAGAPAKLVVGA